MERGRAMSAPDAHGERHFSTFTNFGGFAVGAEFGRAAFGLGAMFAWCIAAALLLHSVRQWFSRQ